MNMYIIKEAAIGIVQGLCYGLVIWCAVWLALT